MSEKKTNWLAILFTGGLAAILPGVALVINAVTNYQQAQKSDSEKETPPPSPEVVQSPSPSPLASPTPETNIESEEVVIVADPSKDIGAKLSTVPQKLGIVYECREIAFDQFSTVAKTTTDDQVTLIKWTKNISGGFTPKRRCLMVSERFQNYENEGQLRYLTTGRINGEDVVCVAGANGDCNRSLDEQGLVFTITSEEGKDNPKKVLLNLFDLAKGNPEAAPINESSGVRIYIDLQKLLPVDKDADCVLSWGCE